MKINQKGTDRKQEFLSDCMIRFLEANKNAIDERSVSLAIRFYKGESLEEIAASEGRTPERIRQLIQRAENQIKKYINSDDLSDSRDRIKRLREDYQAIQEENEILRVTLKVNGIKERTPLTILNLSKRTLNVLENMGINSVETLSKKSHVDILIQKNAGTKTVTEIETALAKFNIRLS